MVFIAMGSGLAVADTSCAIDQVMAAAGKEANKRSKSAIEATMKKRDLEEEACLPILDKLNTQLGMTIPDLSGIAKGLGTQIRNMACKAIDSAVEEAAGQLNAAWEAPYGLGAVGGGVTEGEGGVKLSTSDQLKNTVDKELRDTSIGLLKGGLDVVVDGIEAETSNVTGVNREAANKANKKLKDFHKERNDAINNF